jgi:hypothetical protein
MRIRTITRLSAILIGLGVTPVLAQNAPQEHPHIGGWPTPAQQQQLTTEPGYSIGTGAAHVDSRSNPSGTKTRRQVATQPGNSAGAVAAAHTTNKGNFETR